MKHLPNILTLLNLFCGCIAIAFIVSALPYRWTTDNAVYFRIEGVEQMYMGSIFIGVAALLDMLDGLAARMLHSFSPLGKDLDSLADVVSFGVAPAMIFFKLLWDAYMQDTTALDTPVIVTAPAFLLACFAALRLARFNQTSDEQKNTFIGMPTPAVGLFTASLPLIIFFNSDKSWISWLQNKWILYILIALLCWLMHSPIRFFKWKATGGIGAWWRQIVIALVIIIGAFVINFAIIPVAFLLYILLSLSGNKSSTLPTH